MRFLTGVARKVMAVQVVPPLLGRRSGHAGVAGKTGPAARAIREGRSGDRLASALGRVLSASAFLLALVIPATAAELVMVEEAGCPWCARWDAEVAPAYPATPEGQRAPLRRIGLHEPRPDDLTFDAPLRITPTFVLVDDGEEVARIEGYPGEDFFWPLLGQMLDELPEEDAD